jgi:hypothetical protein
MLTSLAVYKNTPISSIVNHAFLSVEPLRTSKVADSRLVDPARASRLDGVVAV